MINGNTILFKINKKTREMATSYSLKRLNEIVDLPHLYNLLGRAIENKKPNEGIRDCLKKIDLTLVLKESKGINKKFNCSFFADRKAWIHKNEKGYYYYYSRKKKGVLSLDIIDLLAIFRNESQKKVMNFIEKNWNILGFSDWYIEQNRKYQQNIKMIENIIQNKKEYPNLNKLVKKHWILLHYLNEFAKEKIIKEEFAVENYSIFFISNNYLKEKYLPKYSISTINNLINLFCVLGFVKKIPFEQIPEQLSDQLYVFQKKKNKKNHTSYYALENFESVLKEAEERAKILVAEKVSYYQITKEKVKEIFGSNFVNKIYVQVTYGRKKKVEPIYKNGKKRYTESERLEKLFWLQLKEKGSCKKTSLKQTSLLPKNRLNTLWNFLIKKYECTEVYCQRLRIAKPNKILRMPYYAVS